MLGFEFDVLTRIYFWIISLKKGKSVWDAGKKSDDLHIWWLGGQM